MILEIRGGYFEQQPEANLSADAIVIELDSAFGDPNYTEAYPYAVYIKGGDISATVNGTPAADGAAIEAGTDFTLNGVADGATVSYSYKSGENAYVAGLPSEAGTYTVRVVALNNGKYSSTTFNLTINQPGSSGSESPAPSSDGALTGGQIAGIAVGSTVGAIIIAYGVLAILYKKQLIHGAFFAKIFPFIK